MLPRSFTADEQERLCKVLDVLPLEILERLAARLKAIMTRRDGYGQVTITISKGHLHLLIVTHHEVLVHSQFE